jgi:hypothetical protein
MMLKLAYQRDKDASVWPTASRDKTAASVRRSGKEPGLLTALGERDAVCLTSQYGGGTVYYNKYLL